MTKTSKTLKLIFKNDHHKVSTLSLPYASVNLPEAEVKEVMDTIAKENIFANEGVGLYTEPQAAQYVERTINPIFTTTKSKHPIAPAIN